jgi:prophage antirepressor-like protein
MRLSHFENLKMSNLSVFNFNTHSVRAIIDDVTGDPWFVCLSPFEWEMIQ